MSTTVQAEASKPQKKMQGHGLGNLTYGQIWYRQNRGKILARVKEYQARNKEKILAYKKEYWSKNREAIAKKRKEHREQNIEVYLERERRWKQEHRGQYLASRRKYEVQLRSRLFEILGGAKCSNLNCAVPGGMNNRRALHLEHKNNDGYIDKRRFCDSKGNYMAVRAYAHYIMHPEEAKEKLQVWCANCNAIKRAMIVQEVVTQ